MKNAEPLEIPLSGHWFYATNTFATFAFCIEGDKITVTAPIARRWLLSRTKAQARAALRARRYRVVELP